MPSGRPLPVFILTVMLAVSSFPLTGCGSQADAPGALVMDTAAHEAWEIALVEMRIDKNEEFADPARTPLPADKLPTFEGLNYYFPKPELRFRVPLVVEPKADTVTLTKRKGDQVKYVRKGSVAFTHAGKVHRLGVFGPADTASGDYLWLPFFDATTGKLRWDLSRAAAQAKAPRGTMWAMVGIRASCQPIPVLTRFAPAVATALA